MNPDRIETRFVNLQGGRKLAYAIYGAKDLACPVVYLHGFPGSRLEASFAGPLASELGVTIIAPDRPGMGLSDEAGGEPFRSWPPVLEALLDDLGVRRAGLLAVSGGSPFALISALELPERLSRILIVSGVGPNTPRALEGMTTGNKLLFSIARRSRSAATWIARIIGELWRLSPALALSWLRANTRGSDKTILSPAVCGSLMALSIEESLRRGAAAGAREFGWLASDWRNIRLEEIEPKICLWHGLSDVYVPPSMTRSLASRIPRAECRFFEEGGHFMAFEIAREIVSFFTTPEDYRAIDSA